MRGNILSNKVLTADFIDRLADKGYTKKDSAVILADVLDIIYDAIEHGEEIRLMGFGTFTVKQTKSKEYVDVRTGQRAKTKPHNKVSFRAGNALKRAAEEAP